MTAAAEGDKEKPGGSISFTLKAYEAVTLTLCRETRNTQLRKNRSQATVQKPPATEQKTEIRDNEVTGRNHSRSR